MSTISSLERRNATTSAEAETACTWVDTSSS
jgi:hypothetical protein